MRIFVIVTFLINLIIFSSLFAEASSVQDVLNNVTQEMSLINSAQVEFIQEKKMSVFTETLIIKGTLAWERPDSFAWHVLEPIRYAFIMRGGVIRQWDAESNSTQETQVNANPMLKVASLQIERWFNGNYAELSNDYDVSIVSSTPLVLTCAPHQGSPEAMMVSSVTITFRDDLRYISNILINEVSGDTTNIQFDHVKLNEKIPPAAWSGK